MLRGSFPHVARRGRVCYEGSQCDIIWNELVIALLWGLAHGKTRAEPQAEFGNLWKISVYTHPWPTLGTLVRTSGYVQI
jgi:hypothetical protein